MPVLDQLHEGERRAHAFADGGEVEERFGRHRLHRRHHGLVAVGLQINDVVPPDDREHGSGNLFGRYRFVDDSVNLGEFLRIHPVTLRRILLQGSLGKNRNRQRGGHGDSDQLLHFEYIHVLAERLALKN